MTKKDIQASTIRMPAASWKILDAMPGQSRNEKMMALLENASRKDAIVELLRSEFSDLKGALADLKNGEETALTPSEFKRQMEAMLPQIGVLAARGLRS